MITLSSPARLLVVALLTAALTSAGVAAPAAGQPIVDLPATVARRLDGLPAQRAGAKISKAVTTPIPFSMVGFEVPDGAQLEFRTSRDGKRGWGPWTAVEVNAEEGPDAGSAEAQRARPAMSEPVWVGEAGGIQTRIKGRGRSARPEHVGVHLIDSSGLGRSWGRRLLDRARAAWRGTPPAEAAVDRPDIVSRAQWGANERLRRGSPSYASGIRMGFVHHTAGANGYSRAQADDVVRGVYRYHTQSRGWSDIGYNFLVDRFGRVYEGRYGGVAKAVIGAHAGGFNTATFGVSLMGSFDGVKPPRAMRRGLRRLLAWKYDVHHTNVLGTTTYTSYGSTRYAAGRTVTLNRLSGHRNVSSTACPGGSAYALLPSLRRRVADLQGPVILEPRVRPAVARVAAGRLLNGPVEFAAQLRPAGSWTVRLVNPAGTTVMQRRGSGSSLVASWDPLTASPGPYRYVMTSPDRRRVTGRITLVHPTLRASAAPSRSVLYGDGSLGRNIAFNGTLYRGANWVLRITAPNGAEVHRVVGTGRTMSTAWTGPGPGWPVGYYRWTLSADDVPPVGGRLRLLESRTTRIAMDATPSTAAVRISEATFTPLSASRVVLTRGDLPTFALPAGPLAGTGGPVLYTGATQLPSDTLDEVQRVLRPGGTVYVLGSESVISEASLSSLTSVYDVQRLSSSTPAGVAALASDIVVDRSGTRTALVVGSDDGKWRQSAAAMGYGARAGVPTLLTRRGAIPWSTRRALSRNGITRTLVVGDTTAISAEVKSALPSPTRIDGASRASAATAISRRLYGRRAAAATDQYVFFNVSRSDGWTRVLAAAPYAARELAPPLVSGATSVPTATARYLNNLGYTATTMGSGVVVGNTRHVGRYTKDALSALLQ